MEKFNKFLEKYKFVFLIISYPIFLSTIEMQLGPSSKFNLIPIMSDLIGWFPTFWISVVASTIAGIHFICLLVKFYYYLK